MENWANRKTLILGRNEMIGLLTPSEYPNYTMARKADLKGWTYYTSNNVRFQDFSRG